ncbi:uncharacterized protein LOC125206991 [Salvia hispanica]|uniref:uncharacterized protein LOC125206991 n=1 Tax=Salvia hispanica TaxID=49212 RepID=UPI002008F1E1|nr:uncharacterized protein LOC125206991 [Salvia hispanica]
MGDNLETRINQGFELNPTGEKLISDYLIPWVTGQNPIWNGVVEKAIYGDSSPWEIFSDIESRWHSKMEEKGAIKYTVFAFTKLARAQNSKRFCRRAGRGTWDGQTGPKKIKNSDTGCIIGHSKMLVYGQSGEADVGVGHWIMHQYSLSEESVKKSGRANAADLVVCKITKVVKKKDKSDHNTNQSPAAIGYRDFNDAMAAQPESNGESCNFVRFAPETNEGIFNGDYQVQCAQPESYDDGLNYERFVPDTNELMRLKQEVTIY